MNKWLEMSAVEFNPFATGQHSDPVQHHLTHIADIENEALRKSIAEVKP